jgi:hypothetical protein
MMFFKAIFIIQLVLLTGCVTSQIARPPVYEVEMTLSPPVLVNEARELGETLTSALCSRKADSWRISDFGKGEDSDSFSLSSNATMFKFPSQVLKPLGTSSSGIPLFAATQGTIGVPPSRKPTNPNGEMFNSFCEIEGELHFMCWGVRPRPVIKMFELMKIDGWAKRAKYTDFSYPSLQQELIYNGRIENNLKFVYRELASQNSGGSIMRSPFQQEVQYDLNESDVIGFKGARVQIINATNRNVTYKVLEHFPINCSQQ